ncbi:MAG: bifunctional methylenetetrahydrofolate dehydrogenase/methenyltetrahydrofolate cyclohydrolase FolD [Bacillota bacterium]|nr:bifunctional methylenetetrahydrofolate dehydrogenase/methenyltetrahydrofolate cyclohydrolase FolD [Bacillota bacterium]
MGIIIDGKVVSAKVREEVAQTVSEMREKGIQPGLAVVIVGEDPSSKIYVRNKKKACEAAGIYSEVHELPEDTSEQELLSLVEKLNNDPQINGILVQSPLPRHINEENIVEHIAVNKDVDAFHPENVGKIMLGKQEFLPCTPAGVMEMLKYYNIDVAGKECVVVGRSNIVGKPQAMLLLQQNGTVTICHSRTKDLAEVTRRADILVVAIGKKHFITADMVKEGAVVIDVGINRMEDGKIKGDVDFEAVQPKASYITPVPGGVGLMTVSMLLKNTIKAAEMQAKSNNNSLK